MVSLGHRGIFTAWLILCGAVVLHVIDEALTGFLAVYNPTVLAFKARVPWLPLPVFCFEIWLAGLAMLCALLLTATPLVASGRRAGRLLAYVVAVVMVLNAVLHTLGTILGHTVPSVSFPRPMPGFFSSPVLFAAALLVLWRLARTKPPQSSPGESHAAL